MRYALLAITCALGLLWSGCYPDERAGGRAELRLDLTRLGLSPGEAGLDAWRDFLDARAALGQLAQALEYDLDPAAAPFYLDLVLRGRGPYGAPELVGDSVTSPDPSTLEVSLYVGPCEDCSLELLMFYAALDGQVTTFTGVSAPFDIQAFGAPRTLELDAFPRRTGSLVVRGGEPGQVLAAQDTASLVRFPQAVFPAAAGELVLGSIPVGRPFDLQTPSADGWVTLRPGLVLAEPGERLLVDLP